MLKYNELTVKISLKKYQELLMIKRKWMIQQKKSSNQNAKIPPKT